MVNEFCWSFHRNLTNEDPVNIDLVNCPTEINRVVEKMLKSEIQLHHESKSKMHEQSLSADCT